MEKKSLRDSRDYANFFKHFTNRPGLCSGSVWWLLKNRERFWMWVIGSKICISILEAIYEMKVWWTRHNYVPYQLLTPLIPRNIELDGTNRRVTLRKLKITISLQDVGVNEYSQPLYGWKMKITGIEEYLQIKVLSVVQL